MQNKKLKQLLLEGTFVALLALALGHAGPYGTYDKFGLPLRLVFWFFVIVVPWGISKVLFHLAKRFSSQGLSTTYITVLLIPIIALLGSALVTIVNLKVGLYPEQTFFKVWPYSILIWLAFAYFIVLPMALIGKALVVEQRKSGVVTMMKFFDSKLPESLKGSKLLALKAEDHYLRVITDRGSELILMKFEDALAALNGYPGIQTHRSWWLASRSLAGVSSLNASTSSIVLDNGTEVLVSRRRRKFVNEHIASLKNDS